MESIAWARRISFGKPSMLATNKVVDRSPWQDGDQLGPFAVTSSSPVPDWLKKESGTLRHQILAVYSDASKVPDTFFNPISCSGRASGAVEPRIIRQFQKPISADRYSSRGAN